MSTYLFLLLPILIAALLNYILLLIKHKKAQKQLQLYKDTPIYNEATTFPNITLKYKYIRGMKEYISLINTCDLYLGKDYFLIAPFQTFPHKAYKDLILLTDNPGKLISYFYFVKRYKIDKIFLKEKVNFEIEIRFGENSTRYFLKFQPNESDKITILNKLKQFAPIASY